MIRKFQCQKLQFQSLEKPNFSIPATFRIPIFRNAKIYNSSVWKSQNLQFQCLEKVQFTIPMFGKAKIQNSNVLQKANFRIQMLGKSQSLEFQRLEKDKI